MAEATTRLMYHVIDRTIPMWKMLEQAGIDDFPHGESSCYCPFHDNTDTKAAKIYREPQGDRLWCYAEHRMYFPHDVVRLGMIKQSTEQLFNRIWAQLPDSVKDNLSQEVNEPSLHMPENWEEIRDRLIQFQQGDSSYEYVLKSLLELSK